MSSYLRENQKRRKPFRLTKEERAVEDDEGCPVLLAAGSSNRHGCHAVFAGGDIDSVNTVEVRGAGLFCFDNDIKSLGCGINHWSACDPI